MSQAGRSPAVALLTAALLALGPGCGHRGDPLPPLRHTPPGLAEFRLAQRGDALEVSLLAPGASVDGLAYERIVVEIVFAEGAKDLDKAGSRREVLASARQRVIETLPLPAPGTVARAAARGIVGREKGPRTLTMALVAQSPLEAPRDLGARLVAEGVRLRWAGVVPQPVSAAVQPPRLPIFGGRPPTTATAPPVGPGTSVPATAPPLTAPTPTPTPTPTQTTVPPALPTPPTSPSPSASPPAGPTVAPSPTPTLPGVPPSGTPSDTQSPAAGQATTVEPRKAGFHLYRRVGSEAYRFPINPEPLSEPSITDTGAPEGVTVCYEVRAVASLDPLVESDASNESCVEVRDIMPPAPPTGLAVLPRERGLEVLWTPSPELDVVAYRVYRELPGRPREQVAEVEAVHAAWLDGAVRPGETYWYTLTAVDRAGNESPPAAPVEASPP